MAWKNPLRSPQLLTTVTAAVASATKRKRNDSAQAWILPDDQASPGGSVPIQPWQQQGWDLNDALGEVGFPGESLATQASKATWHVVVLPPEAPEPQPSVTPMATWAVKPASEAMAARVWKAFGDFSTYVYRSFYQIWLVGETWTITASDGLVPASGLEIRFGEETRVDDNGVNTTSKYVDRTTDGRWEPETTIRHRRRDMFRIWKPHPARGWEADSSLRSARGAGRTLVGLGMHLDAQIASRLACNGMLWAPNGVAVETPDGDIDSSPNALGRWLATMMSEPLENPATASAVVPLVASVPLAKDGNRMLKPEFEQFNSSLDEMLSILTDQQIRRLALALSIEPEVLLTGIADNKASNHWQAWLTKEETVTNHLLTGLWLLAEAINTLILKHLGLDTDEEGLRVRVLPDVSGLIQRPDRFADVMRLSDAGIIDDSVVLAVAGYSDKDAPKVPQTKDECASFVMLMLKKNPGLAQTPGIDYLMQSVEYLAGLRDEITVTPGGGDVDKSGAGAAGPGRPAAPDARERPEDASRTAMPARGARPTDDPVPL